MDEIKPYLVTELEIDPRRSEYCIFEITPATTSAAPFKPLEMLIKRSDMRERFPFTVTVEDKRVHPTRTHRALTQIAEDAVFAEILKVSLHIRPK